ncbi:MAG TPA: zinc ribbon domain-containing protein [Polaromonas sp.]|uniref:zinc ribbon domain-containing protein n=1 Tax=Polaromonas sp. TaxID=1869339 RepID=UPI002D68A39E|nr:zinc ribbon domain-containing protein [Polaromonas sp.]HYW57037.1 zinc ribbon domain-containing protein [Polaromonas sp.]
MEQTDQEMKKFCDQCGAAARPEARFCGRCGFDMSAMPPPAVQAMAPSSPAFGQDAIEGEAPMSMGLGMAWLLYLGALLLWMVVVMMPNGKTLALIATVMYLGFGFVMTRYVMGSVMEFHPMHNTVANVFKAKLSMFLLWPVSMFLLLFKLTVNRSM